MNLSNLYAFLLDNNIKVLDNPQKDIGKLIERIANFRSSYEEKKLKAEMEELETKAKSEKRKPRKDEIDEINNKIKNEAADIYYKIDISVGVLKFYEGELLSREGYSKSSALNIYNYNNKLFNIYAGALKRFQDAVTTAENRQFKKLMVKLMLNSAVCYTRIGDKKKAYYAYLDAEELAKDNRYNNLLVNVYSKFGDFLIRHGKGIEGSSYINSVTGYFRKAVNIVEESPDQFSHMQKKVENLYDKIHKHPHLHQPG